METLSLNTVDKSHLYGIQYYQEDVLSTLNERLARRKMLAKALILGNIYKQKVSLKFKNRQNTLLSTEATVWAVTESYVILKGHISIPIKSIIGIDIH